MGVVVGTAGAGAGLAKQKDHEDFQYPGMITFFEECRNDSTHHDEGSHAMQVLVQCDFIVKCRRLDSGSESTLSLSSMKADRVPW